MFDANGDELRDLLVEVAESKCPGCELLEDHADETPRGQDRPRGVTPYLARIEADEGPLHPEDEPPNA